MKRILDIQQVKGLLDQAAKDLDHGNSAAAEGHMAQALGLVMVWHGTTCADATVELPGCDTLAWLAYYHEGGVRDVDAEAAEAGVTVDAVLANASQRAG